MQIENFVTISVAFTNHTYFFRMEMNKALNVSCDFNGYLVCQMPDNVVEVELKVKTMMGKYTLIKEFYTKTERYHLWDRVDRRVQIHTRRKKTPQREIKSKDNTIGHSTDSETDIPSEEGFGYPPQMFTNPNFAATLPLTETEPSDPEGPQGKFKGDYCVICVKKYERYWCNAFRLGCRSH